MRKEKSHEHNFDPVRSDYLAVRRLCRANLTMARGPGGAARNEWLPTTAGSLPSSPRQQKETITMKIKWHTVAEWDFSRWFALLSPLIGVLLGVLGVFILYR
jgi:hypothetical protein